MRCSSHTHTHTHTHIHTNLCIDAHSKWSPTSADIRLWTRVINSCSMCWMYSGRKCPRTRRIRMCACMCMLLFHTYIDIHVYVCVHVCVCVCMYVCICVCMYGRVCVCVCKNERRNEHTRKRIFVSVVKSKLFRTLFFNWNIAKIKFAGKVAVLKVGKLLSYVILAMTNLDSDWWVQNCQLCFFMNKLSV